MLRDRQRLVKIQEYCEDIQATLFRYGNTFDKFRQDRDCQNSVAFSILQIGELAVGFTQEYRTATQDRVPWHQIRGMRNIIVHNYGSINFQILWEIATEDIPALKRFCDEQLAGELPQDGA